MLIGLGRQSSYALVEYAPRADLSYSDKNHPCTCLNQSLIRVYCALENVHVEFRVLVL